MSAVHLFATILLYEIENVIINYGKNKYHAGIKYTTAFPGNIYRTRCFVHTQRVYYSGSKLGYCEAG